MSISNIVILFKNLLLERGIYIICRDPRRAFAVIEAAVSLIYPFRWDLPKILSYEPNYEFFMSPIPMIYYFNADKFRSEGLNGFDLSDKCLVYLDSDSIQEYCQDPGLEELPPKLLASLLKQLEATVGQFNQSYLQKKKTISREEFESALDAEEDTISFDYWRVRETFFDFTRELVDEYFECYKESRLFMADNLSSNEIFDFSKFLKSKQSLKNNNFTQALLKTSLFSRFIECRIHPESVSQQVYYSYFDTICKLKSQNPKSLVLSNFSSKLEMKKAYECPQPESAGLDLKQFSYNSVFPTIDKEQIIPIRFHQSEFEGAAIEDYIESL